MVHVKVGSVVHHQDVDVRSIQRINVTNVVKGDIMQETVLATNVAGGADHTQDHAHVPGPVIVVVVQGVGHAADHVIVPNHVLLRTAASLVPSQDPARVAGYVIHQTGMEMHSV